MAVDFVVEQHVFRPHAIAKTVLYAISQPDDVDANEMIIRSVRSAGHAV